VVIGFSAPTAFAKESSLSTARRLQRLVRRQFSALSPLQPRSHYALEAEEPIDRPVVDFGQQLWSSLDMALSINCNSRGPRIIEALPL
jgi:hypothetical protein